MRIRHLLIAAIALVSCSEQPNLPSFTGAALPDLAAPRTLEADDLVEEASDAQLAVVLDDAGFDDGREWVWTDRQGEIWRTAVRVLRFADERGAERYLAWIGDNADTLIGPATRTDDDPLTFEHHASDCCPNKDGPQALAASIEGDLVWTVTLAGPAADASRAAAILPES